MVAMASGSTTTVRVYPIDAADAEALMGGEPHPSHPSAGASVSESIIVHVPPHHATRPGAASGSGSALAGMLPRTGVTFALLLALVAVLLIAVGAAMSRIARRQARSGRPAG